MLSQMIFLFFVCLFNVCSGDAVEYLNYTEEALQEAFGRVAFVSMLFRHGDRTPLEKYPTDPHPLSYWKQGLGQLTNIGKMREYQLGRWTHKRYVDLVKEKPYRYDFVMMNSSDVDRTLMSAELFLAGFYPPDEEEEVWNSDLAWQPIPVHTVPRGTDKLIAVDKPCEKYDLEKDLMNNSPDFTSYYVRNERVFEYVSTHSGKLLSKEDVYKAVNDLWDFYDDLFIEDQNNLTLPTWTKEVYPQPLKSVGQFYFSTNTYTHEMRRLKGGPLLKSIVDDLKRKREDTMWNRTFQFYSGHDSTVAILLDTIGVYNRLAPPYAAAVIVELREKDDDFYVTVLYRNHTMTIPILLQVPGCKEKACTLDEFIKATADVIPDNWEQECEIGIVIKLLYSPYFYYIVLAAILVTLISMLIVISRLHCIRARRHKNYQIIQESVLNPSTSTLDRLLTRNC